MAMNEVYRDAVSLPWPVEEGVVSGDLVAFASGLVGVAETDAKANEAGNGFVATVRVDGVFTIPAGDNEAGVGEAATVVLPTGNVGETVELADAGTAIGTIHRVSAAGVAVALNRVNAAAAPAGGGTGGDN